MPIQIMIPINFAISFTVLSNLVLATTVSDPTVTTSQASSPFLQMSEAYAKSMEDFKAEILAEDIGRMERDKEIEYFRTLVSGTFKKYLNPTFQYPTHGKTVVDLRSLMDPVFRAQGGEATREMKSKALFASEALGFLVVNGRQPCNPFTPNSITVIKNLYFGMLKDLSINYMTSKVRSIVSEDSGYQSSSEVAKRELNNLNDSFKKGLKILKRKSSLPPLAEELKGLESEINLIAKLKSRENNIKDDPIRKAESDLQNEAKAKRILIKETEVSLEEITKAIGNLNKDANRFQESSDQLLQYIDKFLIQDAVLDEKVRAYLLNLINLRHMAVAAANTICNLLTAMSLGWNPPSLMTSFIDSYFQYTTKFFYLIITKADFENKMIPEMRAERTSGRMTKFWGTIWGFFTSGHTSNEDPYLNEERNFAKIYEDSTTVDESKKAQMAIALPPPALLPPPAQQTHTVQQQPAEEQIHTVRQQPAEEQTPAVQSVPKPVDSRRSVSKNDAPSVTPSPSVPRRSNPETSTPIMEDQVATDESQSSLANKKKDAPSQPTGGNPINPSRDNPDPSKVKSADKKWEWSTILFFIAIAVVVVSIVVILIYSIIIKGASEAEEAEEAEELSN